MFRSEVRSEDCSIIVVKGLGSRKMGGLWCDFVGAGKGGCPGREEPARDGRLGVVVCVVCSDSEALVSSGSVMERRRLRGEEREYSRMY